MVEQSELRSAREQRGYFYRATGKPFIPEDLLAIQEAAQAEAEPFDRRVQPLAERVFNAFFDSASSIAKLDRGEELFRNLAATETISLALSQRAIQVDTLRELSLIQSTAVGAQLVMLPILTRIVRNHEGAWYNNTDLDEYFRLLSFARANLVATKIGNICLVDFTQKPKLSDSTSLIAPYLDFLVLALVHGSKREFKKVAGFNNDYPMLDYPNLVQHNIAAALDSVAAIINVIRSGYQYSELDSTLQNKTAPRETRRQIIDSTKSIIDGVKGYMELAYQALLGPNHPQFKAVSSTFAKYLSGTVDERIYALGVLGIDSFRKLRQMYRTAHGFVSKGIHLEIYQPLLFSLNDLIEAYSRANTVSTSEYLPDILISEDYKGVVPTFIELGKSIGEIFSKTSLRKYQLDTESISWGVLLKPQAAEIKFGSSPKQFTIELTWQNEAETLKMALEFDTAKALFDWSFPESPNEPKMSLAKTAAFLAAAGILSHLKKLIEDLIQERLRQRITPQISQITPSRRQERIAAYSRGEKREIAEKEDEGSAIPIMRTFQELEAGSQDREIRRVVVIPDDPQQLRELLSEIGENDFDRVTAALKEFNEAGGKGKGFKRLITEGSPKYEISIGSVGGGHKGIRVILLPDESSEGVQKLTIYTAWYRGDAFKRHKKKELWSF